MKLDFDKYLIKPGSKVILKDYDTGYEGELKKKQAKEEVKNNIAELVAFQEKFWADDRYSMLIVLQARDAAGKDSAIKHVMSGLNPQSCRVHSYQTPTRNELDHNYLWRHFRDLPARGEIGIFNRSHYENVLATKVNPQFLLNEKLPDVDSPGKADEKFWEVRYEQINNFEKHLYQNGCIIIKIFLNVSKDKQKERLLDRLNIEEKNWKFSSSDLIARALWDEYEKAYEEMMEKTSTHYAPWYVVPADKKFFTRVVIGEIIVKHFKELDLRYPLPELPEQLVRAKEILMNEK
jgi:PPK2 family polyphosphate:nucleotide phosphotransferase